ncbi:hypothetical protein LAD12857_03110 [Lacrimispora amygdalina]|uniref:DUF3343 domain-containing protein n=1 Tax=Lacrimispora amygdalina TaxID=253257 RepID=A0A3E2NFI0_9FIRM|nr:DUF3343 domain-containing protein [Clostridium indicum]RFZ79713.1 DUF3343 domain-containing protein [Clostridium indicum]
MEDILLTFQNTHHSIMAETLLLGEKIPVKVMPMPEAITAGCGLCLRLPEGDCPKALEILEQGSIIPRGIYKKTAGEYSSLPIERFQASASS